MTETKSFPSARVTAINLVPLLLKGIQKAYETCNHLNLAIGSLDGKRILFVSILNEITREFEKRNHRFRNVFVLGKRQLAVYPKIEYWANKHLKSLLSKTPFPYCFVTDWNNDQDVALACSNVAFKDSTIEKERSKLKKYQIWLEKTINKKKTPDQSKEESKSEGSSAE